MGKELEEYAGNELVDLTSSEKIAQDIILFTEDDRRKSNQLFEYYQKLIDGGDTKGETREALAKALELREKSVLNLIEILKLKTRLIEKKMSLEFRRIIEEDIKEPPGRRSGRDHTGLIAKLEEGEGKN